MFGPTSSQRVFGESVSWIGKNHWRKLVVFAAIPSAAKQLAEKVDIRCPAPKGASDFEELTVSLKRYPDTKPSFSATC
jgi:hypothetical protein